MFQTDIAKFGVYICYDRHFPEGARALGLNGAEIVLIPSATSRGLSEYLWHIEQRSHAVANGYFVGTINRVGIEPLGDDDFYGQSYFSIRAASTSATIGDAHDEELIVRDLDLDMISRCARPGSSTVTAGPTPTRTSSSHRAAAVRRRGRAPARPFRPVRSRGGRGRAIPTTRSERRRSRRGESSSVEQFPADGQIAA